MTVFYRNLPFFTVIYRFYRYWPDSGDGDEDEDEDEDEDDDEDEDKDEIPNYAVLLTASVKRFGVSRMRDFKTGSTLVFKVHDPMPTSLEFF